MNSIINAIDQQKFLYCGIITPLYDPMNDFYDHVDQPTIQKRLEQAKMYG